MTATTILSIARTLDRTKHDTGAGIGVIACHTRYALDTPVESILDNTAIPAEAVFTQDGRDYIAEWHTGDESGDTIYVERWTADGLAFHGFVDSRSRRIVQAG